MRNETLPSLPAAGSSPLARRAPLAGLSLGGALVLGFGLPLVFLAAIVVLALFYTEGHLQLLLVAFALCAGTAGVLAATWLVRRIALPLRAAVAEARRLSSGDLTRAVAVQGGGEIAQLLRA